MIDLICGSTQFLLHNSITVQFNIEFARLCQVREFDIRRRGTNEITEQEFTTAIRYCGEKKDDQTDITIITGAFWNDPQSQLLLLMRFHRLNPLEYLSPANIQELYQNVKKLCGKHGFEYKRTGGRSGRVQVTKEFLQFMNNRGTFPRSASSVKVVQNCNQMQWDCYYIGVDDAKVKKVSYCNIKSGGSFRMPAEMMSKYGFLQEFLAAKSKAALLLYEINGSEFDAMIQPNAVRQEICNLKQAMAFDFHMIEWEARSDRDKKVSKREFVMRYLSTMNRHTMVEHPVGFHLDLIRSQPVLENKVCF